MASGYTLAFSNNETALFISLSRGKFALNNICKSEFVTLPVAITAMVGLSLAKGFVHPSTAQLS